MTSHSMTPEECFVHITEGNMAPVTFQRLSPDVGFVVLYDVEYMALVRNDGEIELAPHEVDRYYAMQLGKNWDDERNEFIRQAIDQLRAQRLTIIGESVGQWLTRQSHFFMPEEIDAVIAAVRKGGQL